MRTRLKICGIRRMEDVQYLNEALPDFAGFICAEGYWRYVPPETLRDLSAALDPRIARVGVFVDSTPEEIERFAPYLDVLQLHGAEGAAYIEALHGRFPHHRLWKAVRVRTAQDIADADALPVEALVLDSFSHAAHGGTGTLAPWDIIAKHRPEKPFLLAGGITPENVQRAVREVQPWGVDASSSLETDRCKDGDKITALVRAVRNDS